MVGSNPLVTEPFAQHVCGSRCPGRPDLGNRETSFFRSHMMGKSALLHRLAGIVFVLGVAVAPPVWAQDEIDVNIYAREGFYLGVGATFANPSFADGVDETVTAFINAPDGGVSKATSESTANWAFGFNVRGGYRFHPHFALEVEYEWIETDGFPVLVGISEIGEKLSFDFATIEYRRPEWVVTVNPKVYLNKGRAQLFVMVGMGAMKGSIEPGENPVASGLGGNPVPIAGLGPQRGGPVEDTVFTWRFGGGMDFYLTEHIVMEVAADYVYPMGSLQNVIDYVSISLGLQYRF